MASRRHETVISVHEFVSFEVSMCIVRVSY